MIITILSIILTHFINIYSINLFVKPRFNKKINYTILAFFLFLLLTLNFLPSSRESNYENFIDGFLVASFICTVIIIIISRDKLLVKLFYILTYLNIFIVLHVFSLGICNSFLDQENYKLYYSYIVLIRSLLFIPLIIVYQIYGKKYIEKNFEENNKNWWLLSLTAFSMLIMMLLIAKQNNYFANPTTSVYIYLLIGFFIEFVVYSIVFSNIVLNKEAIKIEQIRMKNDYLNNQIESLNKQEEEMVKLRHDVRHHILYVIECAQNNNTAAIIKYLKEYNENIQKFNEYKLCTNETINMVLLAYRNKAINNNIEFFCQTKIDKVYIETMDLISIFGNILENAYNSCLIYEKDNPKIEVFIKEIGNKLCIICSNSCNDDILIENDIIRNKGIGIKSIIDTVSKYHGEVKYKKNTDLCLSVLIPNIPK